MGLRKEVIQMSEIAVTGSLSDDEITRYIAYAKREHPGATLTGIKVINDEEVELTYKAPPFERIRRITGYLVGTLDRWNNAKRAEEADRVKHGVIE